MKEHFKIKRILEVMAALCLLLIFYSTVNGAGLLSMETDHFIYYFQTVDKTVINTIDAELESNYSRITSRFNYSTQNKILIEIYPNLKEFHEAIGNPGAPDWIVGSARNGKIQMVSPLNPGPRHTYDSLIKASVHEFVHVILQGINYQLPIWLNEGIASYESKNITNIREVISEDVKNNRVPTLEDLSRPNFADIKGYQYSSTIIEFVVKKYGYPKIIELIKSPADFTIILGLSECEFYQKWVAYLAQNYQ